MFETNAKRPVLVSGAPDHLERPVLLGSHGDGDLQEAGARARQCLLEKIKSIVVVKHLVRATTNQDTFFLGPAVAV